MLTLGSNSKVEIPIMYFNNDDDFYRFCVEPKLIPSEYTRNDGSVGYYTDWKFTPQCQQAIDNGVMFCIKDENSQIYKHGAVSYRTCTKPLNNLQQYFPSPKKNQPQLDIKSLDTYINDEKA